MPEELPKIYWDANVFLSYINGIADRLADIDALLEQSGTELQLISSAISVVEVAFGKAEQDNKVLDPAVEAKIRALWGPASPVRLVEFYPLIAEGAKWLLRESMARGWTGLKPIDAIHLSTARQERAAEFHTYDDLGRYAAPGPNGEPPILDFKIGPPKAKQPKLPST